MRPDVSPRGSADDRAQGGQFGPYRLVRQIATGGMAEIHLAKTRGIEGFEKYVALKMIHPNFSSDEHFIEMLIDEAKISVQLTHVNIAQTFDLGRVGDTYYIAMEFVDGSDLFRVLRKSSEQDRYMPVETGVWIAKEVCAGLDYAHGKRDMAGRSLGIIHRDVSPQNVLLSHAGEVKLVDFGIAKATMRAKQTAVGVIKGKYYYMSPEQAWGDKLDNRTDIFSAGILLYEMLTGQMLYLEEDMGRLLDLVRRADIPPPSTKRPEVPRELDRIVMRALAKKPDLRWQTAHDFGVELEKFLHSYAPDFTAQRLAGFVGEVLGPRPSPAAPAPTPAAPVTDEGSNLPRGSIAASRSEFTDDHSVIFSLADKVAEPGGPPAPQRGVSPNRLTTPAAMPPVRPRPAAGDRLTRPSAPLPVPIKPLAARLAGSVTHNVAITDESASRSPSPPAPPRPPPPPRPPARPVSRPEPVQHTVDISDEDLELVEPDEIIATPSAAPAREAAVEPTVDQPTTVDPPRRLLADLAVHEKPAVPGDEGEEPTQIDVASLGARSSRPMPAAPAPRPPRPTRRTPGSVPIPAPSLGDAHSSGSSLPLTPPVTEEHTPAPVARPTASQPASVVWPPQAGDDSIDDFFGIKIGGSRLNRRQVLLVVFGLCGLVGLGALAVAALSPPPEPRYATLEVISIPPGGRVSVDGKALGQTPVALERVPLDRRLTLRVDLERYEPWQREETFDEPRPVKIVASLKPILGSLSVESVPLGAEVFVNNRSVGKTPLEHELSPFDDGFVEVRKQGYKPSRQPLEWRGRRQVSLTFELQPAQD